MLPEKSLQQLKKLRKEVKGIDINDKVSKKETKFPNLYYMDNPIDGGRVISYEEFTKKDNKQQTTAFKSKLVNQPLINKQLKENVNKDCFMEFSDLKDDYIEKLLKLQNKTEDINFKRKLLTYIQKTKRLTSNLSWVDDLI